jgi:hypothetical protein
MRNAGISPFAGTNAGTGLSEWSEVGMFTAAGNAMVIGHINAQHPVNPRMSKAAAVRGWKDIQREHGEVSDTVVRENVLNRFAEMMPPKEAAVHFNAYINATGQGNVWKVRAA